MVHNEFSQIDEYFANAGDPINWNCPKYTLYTSIELPGGGVRYALIDWGSKYCSVSVVQHLLASTL